MPYSKTITGAALVVLLALTADPAHATRCLYPERAVAGPVRGKFKDAQNAAIGAWQSAVARKNGKRFANWYYSGDRTINCNWNDRGNRIRCQAVAVPCGE
jgi:hypothetical protein